MLRNIASKFSLESAGDHSDLGKNGSARIFLCCFDKFFSTSFLRKWNTSDYKDDFNGQTRNSSELSLKFELAKIAFFLF